MTGPATPAVPRVFIAGSCVSRDILNISAPRSVSLADYVARSSLAGAGCTGWEIDEAYYGLITSEFQRKMVRRDVTKSLVRDLATGAPYDLVLIDLIDERFDLYEVAPDLVISISGELLSTRMITSSDRNTPAWIKSGSARHRQLWRAGVERLFGALMASGRDDCVVINQVWWAENMVDGTPLPQEQRLEARRANELLSWMYDELRQFVPPARWMTFPDNYLRSNPDHRWGPAPFHFADAYYADAMRQLHAQYVAQRQRRGQAGEGAVSPLPPGLGPDSRVGYVVFRDGQRVHLQGYAADARLGPDLGAVPGRYKVCMLVLSPNSRATAGTAVGRREIAWYVDIPATPA